MKYKYCPNGNYWKDASGVFDQRTYLYCNCKGCGEKIYELRPIDVTNKLSKEAIQSARDNIRHKEVRDSVTYANMEDVAKITLDEIKNKSV